MPTTETYDAVNPAKRFQDLLVWQRAHAWVLEIYKLTQGFPSHEIYTLTNQLRRSAISVPANIAEGFSKRSIADKGRFYNIAQGSVSESLYYLILAADLGYAKTQVLQDELNDISRLLNGYIQGMQRRAHTS